MRKYIIKKLFIITTENKETVIITRDIKKGGYYYDKK